MASVSHDKTMGLQSMGMGVEKNDSQDGMQVDYLDDDVDFCLDSIQDEDMIEDQGALNQEEFGDQMMEKLMNEAKEDMDHYIGLNLIFFS